VIKRLITFCMALAVALMFGALPTLAMASDHSPPVVVVLAPEVLVLQQTILIESHGLDGGVRSSKTAGARLRPFLSITQPEVVLLN
jgi:hypothetical protein